MIGKFYLFNSHIDLAHHYWKRMVIPGDIVIDATCGNGHDTFVLASLALGQTAEYGKLYAMDIQEKAILATKDRLAAQLTQKQAERVEYIQGCHSNFPKDINKESVKLIVYNLGYLPGGNKGITTQTSTTLESLRSALDLTAKGGAISVTCYPGHQEGLKEQESILAWAAELNKMEWSVCHHTWLNRQAAPSLLFLQKGITPYAGGFL